MRSGARAGIALALVAGCAAIALARSRPPAPRGTETPETEFSAARGLEVLRRVLGDGAPHPVGTQEHGRVRARIVAELLRIGLDPKVEESAASSGTAVAFVENVVATIPGTEDSKAVLLCAHYDSVPAGAGASDDGSGVATILEVARALKAGPPPRRPVTLLLTDAEECGLVGAEAFASSRRLRDEFEVVVNIDARGTCGPTFLFETSAGNADLVRLYGRSVDRPCATSTAYEVYERMPNDTDLTVFKRAGVAGLNFAFIGGLRRYHTPLDDLAHLSPASLQHEGDQVLALTRALASEQYEAKAADDLVYADVLGLWLLRWPESRSLPGAIAIVVILTAMTIRKVREQSSAFSAVARGFLLALAAVAASAAAATAIVRGIELLRAHPEPWAGHPLPSEIAVVAGALAAALVLARIPWLARAKPDTWLGTWIAVAIAGVAVSATVPGASYLFLAPGAVAILARALPDEAAAAAPACALVVLWIPLTSGLVQALELGAPAALGLPVGWMIAAALPMLLRVPRIALRSAVLVLLVSLAWAIAAPSSTKEDPAWLNLSHVEDADTGTARIVARTYGVPLPSEMRAEASFSTAREPAFPGIGWLPEGFVAPAESAPTEAPRIEVLSERTAEGRRALEVRISSPRVAPCLTVHLSGLHRDPGSREDAMVWAELDGRKLGLTARLGTDDGEIVQEFGRSFFGLPAEGIVLAFEAQPDRPVRILLLDAVYGLPECDAEFANARPERFVPRRQGDQWIVARRVEL